MRVLKRTGHCEDVSFDKVLNRIRKLSNGLSVDVYDISQKVCGRIYDMVKTSELDELAAYICSSMMVEHPDYGVMASRIIISNHQKNTSPSFSETVQILYDHALVSKELYDIVMRNKEKLNNYIDYSLDYNLDYFGFKTLERSYLLRVGNAMVERPQHMFMRVSIGIHRDDIKEALLTYELMANKYFTHATPTLFNAGTPRPQCSSCFLLANNSDSIAGIYDTLAECAQISKYAGGIGLHIHDVRAKGSKIRGTNGISTGIIPMLRVFNNTARYVNQSGKRNGSIAIFLEPWHADVEAFLDLRKNHGHEEERTRDLFLALWIPNIFMERVKQGGTWSLMCPDLCKGLSEVYGDKFNDLYLGYEREGRYVKQVNAQDLWFKILESQIETGTPYLVYKDAANEKSNQKNLGTIKSSNLCSEIIEYSSPDEIAVCNLASICLPRFVARSSDDIPMFDFEKLHEVVEIITKNLNKVIDINYYPVPKARTSNLRHRPIGIGIQGLADTYAMMRIPFESDEARDLNLKIFETIYHGALVSSVAIAKKRHTAADLAERNEYDPPTSSKYPGAYSTFAGSPASQGLLQYDLWGATPYTDRYDWSALKQEIMQYGLRNSLLIAPMPTASTSQIMGFNESFEAFTSNMYKRKTLAGEFIVINKYLMADLIKCGMWNPVMRDAIIMSDGSIQTIEGIPQELKDLYKTVWEIKQKAVIDQAADRGIFICQSQSMNLYIEDPDYKKLTSMHFYAWSKGLKTGVYYLRSKPRAQTQKFTIEPPKKQVVCTDEVCVVCSS
jgi:ribonucleoside-diphosphate reductase alpha chain